MASTWRCTAAHPRPLPALPAREGGREEPSVRSCALHTPGGTRCGRAVPVRVIRTPAQRGGHPKCERVRPLGSAPDRSPREREVSAIRPEVRSTLGLGGARGGSPRAPPSRAGKGAGGWPPPPDEPRPGSSRLSHPARAPRCPTAPVAPAGGGCLHFMSINRLIGVAPALAGTCPPPSDQGQRRPCERIRTDDDSASAPVGG